MMVGQQLGSLRGLNVQQDNQMWFHQMVRHTLQSTMDSGERAFGEGVEGALDQRQTRHPNRYYSENDDSWVGKWTHTILIATP